MHTFILEDWITVSGPGSDTITQDEVKWIDLEPFQDVVFYVECREATNGPTLVLQTAPAKDDSLFQQVVSAGTMNGTSTAQVFSAIMANSTTPLARYVRWQIQGPIGSAWDAHFRVLVAANSPGM